ncbi:hypothetical protein FRC10_010337 [Ceratobasidium sp. 414]|nr:hypothetical protein FRC10_010337 [Ceratobasidium sp. 414]
MLPSQPAIDDEKLTKEVERKVDQFQRLLDGSPGIGSAGSKRGQMTVVFSEMRPKKAWFSSGEEEVPWEEWTITTEAHSKQGVSRATTSQALAQALHRIIVHTSSVHGREVVPAIRSVMTAFTTTATFESQDEAYRWITEWLERQPSYSTSSDFEVVAKPRTIVDADPSILESQSGEKSLSSRPLATYFPAPVLEPKIKERLFGDVKEFLEGKQWYAQRGIPYRRGYLLFGTPGSGKTSSIHALASELRLDIYIVPLSLKAIDDGILSDLITSMPQRCILLYEDIDAAFRARNASSASGAYGNLVEKSGITLSGLLNTIDGVQAQEGCLLFATSNHPERLDPALIRPGRMDVKIEYNYATQWQAEQLFRLFYPEQSGKEKSSIESASKLFAEAIPPSRLSVAQLQGYLMRHKGRHEDAAQGVKKWIEEELPASA